jgi:hypothetical protein
LDRNSRPILIHHVDNAPAVDAAIDATTNAVYGFVTPDGDDWVVSVVLVGGEVVTRFYSTHRSRPDNGALTVTRKLRQQFGITGTFKVQ